MQNCEPLAWYGYAVVLLSGCMILVPYLRGKQDLFSAWNFLLAGIAIFVGLGSIEAASSPMRFPGLDWFNPTKAEVSWFMTATTIFLVSLFLAHYLDPFSKAIAARTLNKWPPLNSKVLLFVAAICVPLALAAQIPFLARTVFIGTLLVNVSHKAIIFSCLFVFLLWYRNRTNLVWLAIFIGLFLTMCFLAILVSGGRRMLLSVCLGPFLAFYFLSARNWRPSRALVILTVCTGVLFVTSLMYSTIRHFDRRGGRKERTAASAIEAVKRINLTDWYERFARDVLWNFSQHVVHYGLLVDRFVETDQLEPRPFNTFHFLAVYPIPRRVYPNKPRSLGHNITFGVLGRTTTWGTGVSGHAKYEGGLALAAMFGYFAAGLARLFDDPLRRMPTNPFLIGMLASAGMHWIAWPRGDLAVMTFEVVECLFFAWGIGFLCRFVFGTARAPMASQIGVPNYSLAYPANAG